MPTNEEIEAIRAARAAKAAVKLTALCLGVEYPEGTEVWKPVGTLRVGHVRGAGEQFQDGAERAGVIVSVNPMDRSEVAVSDDGNRRRWSNTPRNLRHTLGRGVYPTRDLARAAFCENLRVTIKNAHSHVARTLAEIGALSADLAHHGTTLGAPAAHSPCRVTTYACAVCGAQAHGIDLVRGKDVIGRQLPVGWFQVERYDSGWSAVDRYACSEACAVAFTSELGLGVWMPAPDEVLGAP